MRRIFSNYSYGPEPRKKCWWDQTVSIPKFPPLEGQLRADVAIVGGGFTGLNAALTLAEGGASVVVLDLEQPGWGASGRNGGFCCLGGGKASDRFLDKRFGRDARLEWRRTEMAAVAYVQTRVSQLKLDVDQHSEGETMLAHRARDARSFEATCRAVEENYGVTAQVIEEQALRQVGLGGRFFGALTIPLGFALNPKKYLAGLVDACGAKGVQIFGQTGVEHIEEDGSLHLTSGVVRADRIVVATNGYSSEDVPKGLRSAYMPAQSSVMVTRPLQMAELQEQGWDSAQMAYDTRQLLHYFRLMPDRRFLFGMRGGILSSPNADARLFRTLRSHFDEMFPAWQAVETEGMWSGMISLARNRTPFVGELPGQSRILAGLCFHGNGVAMGSFTGHLLGQIILGQGDPVPTVLSKPMTRFPLGRLRRTLMAPLYAGLQIADL